MTKTLPAAMRAYITASALCALVVAFALAVTGRRPQGGDVLVAVQVVGLVFLAKCYPVHLAPKSKFYLDTAPTLAAVVLLPPTLAVLTVAIGVLAGEVWKHARRLQVIFNVSVALLNTAVGTLVLRIVAGAPVGEASLSRLAIAAVPTMLVMLAFSLVLVNVAVALSTGSPFTLSRIWQRHHAGLPYEAALAMLGLVCAYAAADVPWVLSMMAVPGVLIYVSLRDGLALRQRTMTTLTQLADLSDGGNGNGGMQHGECVAALCSSIAAAMALKNPELMAAIAQAGRLHSLASLGGPNGTGGESAVLAAKLLSGEAAAEIIRCQFERWDGSGCPSGLRGEQITVGARILAVADAHIHLTEQPATAVAPIVALALLQSERGSRFDPAVLDALAVVVDGTSIRTEARRPISVAVTS